MVDINRLCQHIGESMVQGILLEVTTYPKPGLVTPVSNGAHDDMNLQTFMLSSAAIAPCFTLCAEEGFHHQGTLPELLKKIRHIGIYYEDHLLQTTRNVNTQRGILFSGSVLCAAAGYLSAQKQVIEYTTLCSVVKQICMDLCEQDFARLKLDIACWERFSLTAGEQLYLRHKVTGIRGEAESGFPCVLDTGLPALEKALASGIGIRLSLVQCLLEIMTCCEDTTVIWRAGLEALRDLQQKAATIVMSGGVFTPAGIEATEALDQYCCQCRISPGGAADLLAMTVAMYLLKNKNFPDGLM